MKTLLTSSCFLCILILIACSKNDKQTGACTLEYILPSLNFNIVNQSSGADLFFSENSLYKPSDLKVHFKNGMNRIDSVTPSVLTRGDKKYFSFKTSRASLSDTCIIKIKNAKADTLTYTIANTDEICPRPYINGLKVNNAGYTVILKPDQIVNIEK